MAVKERLLTLLEENRMQGNWLSGEKLAVTLGVSRAAVWKAAQALREEGFSIDAQPRSGYRLAASSDILSRPGVCAALGPPLMVELDPQVYRSVSSTNLVARQAAVEGAPEGLVVLAESQEAGRGRLGRSFYSPPDTGLYMSVLLRPRMEAERAVLLTTAAAVAVCEGLEAITGREARIKWVNDVLLDGKKVCGILTEAAFGTESGHLEYTVTGIGINVYAPRDGFPPELAQIAGAVFPSPDKGAPPRAGGLRNRLAADILRRFWGYSRQLEARTFLPEYRRRSVVLGQAIDILQNGCATPARALAIDDNCRLLVRTEEGVIKYLSTGEISIRLHAQAERPTK